MHLSKTVVGDPSIPISGVKQDFFNFTYSLLIKASCHMISVCLKDGILLEKF